MSLFSSAPAVRTELARLDIDRFDHVIETVIMKRREIELLADLLQHRVILIGIGICILLKHFLCEVRRSFQLLDLSSRDQFLLGIRPGEIKVLASEHKRRTGRPDVDLFRAAVVQVFRRLSKLCAADNGIVDEQKLLSSDQRMDRDQLHLGDQVSSALLGRHEGPGPCGRILHEWP